MMETSREDAAALFEARARIRNQPRLARGLLLLPKYVRYRMTPFHKQARRVVIPTFWGGEFEGILPERVTSVIARYSFFDQDLCRSMLRYLRPGDTMVDIGAHFGFFSLLGSWLVGAQGRVLSIEAIGSTCDQLRKNVAERASHPNVTVVHAAAGDEAGRLEFQDLGLEFSSLNTAFEIRGPMAERLLGQGATIEVDMMTMDSICASHGVDRVDFVKIDAESSEHLVIGGFERLLSSGSPLISLEVSDLTPGEKAHTERVLDALSLLGYQPYRVTPDGVRAVATGEPIGYANFLLARPDDARVAEAF